MMNEKAIPQTLLREAARWGLIGMLFERPAGDWRERLTALSSVAADPDLTKAAEAAREEASEGLYHSVFGPGGFASPREVSYHGGLELGGLMSELTGYYNAFGYRPEIREPGDHIAVEAGFVGYLYLKEAYARACDDIERADMAADAARHFIEDHISAAAEPIAAALGNSGIRYLALAGSALLKQAADSHGFCG